MSENIWWIIQKDLVCEYRNRWAWPRMMLLGLTVACLLAYQLNDATPEVTQRLAPSLCWLTICFAAVMSLGQSLEVEREEGCWEGLVLYPVTPQTIYFAKLTGNALALGGLQCVVMPVFAILSKANWLRCPGEIVLVSVLANLGIVSIGTLLGAFTAGMRQGQSVLAVVLLPLLIPVILAASEATRLSALGFAAKQWQLWVQLLGASAVVYAVAGWMLFDFVVEE